MSENQIDELLDDLLDKALDSWRQGNQPDTEALCADHPEVKDELQRLLTAMLLMEGAKPESESESESSCRTWGALGDAPEELGDYRIIGEIGRGGMGVVYEAEQISLGRRVALKVLPHQISRDPVALRRFEREARAAARLHHTNIVPVFEIGQSDDANFYTMQLIQGSSLEGVLEVLKGACSTSEGGASIQNLGDSITLENASYSEVLRARIATSLVDGRFHAKNFADPSISGSSSASELADTVNDFNDAESARFESRSDAESQSLEPSGRTYWRNVARMGVQVAQALAYSHAHGIVHRDIKPANLILDESGIVWVTDFGLALTIDSDMTQSGDVLGTLRFMSPERFDGICTERSDLYSLGVTLYELLTLRPAFESTSRLQLIELIRSSELEPPGKRGPAIPRDLETIVLKSCEKDPANRYSSAAALADDLQRFLHDEPIQARTVSSLERMMRWSRRNVGLAASLTAVAVLLLILTATSLGAASYFRIQQNAQQRLAFQKEKEAARAISAERASQTALYQAQMRMAGSILNGASGTDQVLELTDRWDPRAAGRDLRDWEWYFLRSLCRRERLSIDTGQFMLWSVDWSPDGSRIVTTGSRGSVKVWDAQNGELRYALDRPAGTVVISVCWNPDGTRFVLAAGNALEVWDANHATLVSSVPNAHRTTIYEVAWSPDGSRFASAGADRYVRVWDVESGEKKTEKRFGGEVRCVAWSDDSRSIAVGGPFQTIYVLDAETAKEQSVLTRHTSTVGSVAWDPNGARLASVGQDRTLKMWDLTKKSLHRYSIVRPTRMESVVWNPKGDRLAGTQWNGEVLIVDVDSPRKVHHLFGHEDRAWDVDWNPDGTQVASVALDGELKIWELSVANESRALIGGERGYEKVAWSADGDRLAASTEEKIVVWDSLDRDSRVLTTVDSALTSLRWSPDGRRLATATGVGSAKVWDVLTGALLWEPNPESGGDTAVAWSPDGRLIATANQEALTLHRADGKEVVRVLATELSEVESMDWRGDSLTLATSHADGTITLWSAESGDSLGRLTGHSDAATAIRWNTVRIWDATRGYQAADNKSPSE